MYFSLQKTNAKLRDENDFLGKQIYHMHKSAQQADVQRNEMIEAIHQVKKDDLHLPATKDRSQKLRTVIPDNVRDLRSMPSFEVGNY